MLNDEAFSMILKIQTHYRSFVSSSIADTHYRYKVDSRYESERCRDQLPRPRGARARGGQLPEHELPVRGELRVQLRLHDEG